MPKITYKKSCSKDELKKLVFDATDLFDDFMKEDDYYEINETMRAFRAIYDDQSVDRDELTRYLIESEFIAEFAKLLYWLDRKDPTLKKNMSEAYARTLQVGWAFSDMRFELATLMIESKIGDLMMRNVMQKLYLRDIDDSYSRNFYILHSSLSIINNMIRFPGYRDIFDTVIFKDTLVELSSVDDEVIQVLACLCLANLINEKESHLLENASQALKFIVKSIENSKKSSDGRFSGFTTLEMIQGLKALSGNDLAKRRIVEGGCLDLIESILVDEQSPQSEILEITTILWNLTFDESLKSKINSSRKIKKALKSLLNSNQDLDLKKNVEGVINCCEGTIAMTKKIEETSSNTTNSDVKSAPSNKDTAQGGDKDGKFDVFMSYCWQNSEKVHAIVKSLKNANLKVWLDIDQMEGSTLEAMAEGIDNSKIIVIGMSEGYKNSPNCRTEGEYAHYLRKPIVPLILRDNYRPNGWLGMMLGTKLYFDFSDSLPFSEMIEKLIDTLKKKLQN